MNPVPFLQIHYEFTICFANPSEFAPCLVYSLSVTLIHIESFWINLNQLSIWLIYFEFSIRECTINSKPVSHIHLKSTICFSESLWIHYLLGGFSRNSISFREIAMNSLFTICFANWLWMNYLFRVSAINSLSHFCESLSLELTLNSLESTLSIASSLLIHYILRRFTLNTQSTLWFYDLL